MLLNSHRRRNEEYDQTFYQKYLSSELSNNFTEEEFMSQRKLIGLTTTSTITNSHRIHFKMISVLCNAVLKSLRNRKWPENESHFPIFILSMTLLQCAFFLYYVIVTDNFKNIGPVLDNPFIFISTRFYENPWHLLTYVLVHKGWEHFINNVACQLIVGIYLETEHGSLRTILIYLSCMIAGPIGTVLWESNDFKMMGSSSAIYGLTLAHLSNIILNFDWVSNRLFKFVTIIVIVCLELVFMAFKGGRNLSLYFSTMLYNAFYVQQILSSSSSSTDKYHHHQLQIIDQENNKDTADSLMIITAFNVNDLTTPTTFVHQNIGYVSHLTGCLIGLLTGLVVLKIYPNNTPQNLPPCHNFYTRNRENKPSSVSTISHNLSTCSIEMPTHSHNAATNNKTNKILPYKIIKKLNSTTENNYLSSSINKKSNNINIPYWKIGIRLISFLTLIISSVTIFLFFSPWV